MTPMSEASPCLNCGACCSHFRVSFFWGECASSGGTVPDDLVVQINHTRVAMIGTDQKPARCCSLEGVVGKGTRCTIYEQRSSVCRAFDSSWSQGVQSTDCDYRARKHSAWRRWRHRPSSGTCPSALSVNHYRQDAKTLASNMPLVMAKTRKASILDLISHRRRQ